MRLTKKNIESLKCQGDNCDIDSTQDINPNNKQSKMLPRKHRFGSKKNKADKITIIGQPGMFEFDKFIG